MTPSMKMINSNHGQPKTYQQQVVFSWLVVFHGKKQGYIKIPIERIQGLLGNLSTIFGFVRKMLGQTAKFESVYHHVPIKNTINGIRSVADPENLAPFLH